MAYSPCQQQAMPVKSSQVKFTPSSAAESKEWQLDLLAGLTAEDFAKYWRYEVHGLHQHWQKPCVSIADGILTIHDWENVFMRKIFCGEKRCVHFAGRPAEEFARIGIVECMAFSSDGRVLGVSTADGLLTIYDWHTGRPLNVLRCAAAKLPAGRIGRLYCMYPVGQSPTS